MVSMSNVIRIVMMLPQVAQRLSAQGPGHALHGGGAGAGDPMGGPGPEYYDMCGPSYYDAYDELGYQVHV